MTAADRLRARLAGLPDLLIIAAYLNSARKFQRNPHADEHRVLLDALDIETTKRDIPCCPDCSVPTSTGYHIKRVHRMATNPAAVAVVDALTAAVDTAHAQLTGGQVAAAAGLCADYSAPLTPFERAARVSYPLAVIR